jgi:hypothetical protein
MDRTVVSGTINGGSIPSRGTPYSKLDLLTTAYAAVFSVMFVYGASDQARPGMNNLQIPVNNECESLSYGRRESKFQV